jgi:hypothetical protein
MVSESVFTQQVYPALTTQTFGTTPTRPKSGYFSLHFTYPDTTYEDPVETTWAAGGNQQGMHFLIRSPQAGDVTSAVAADGTNFVVIDLKRAAEANQQSRDDNPTLEIPVLTYDLGTEEATRLIASVINSTRNHQTGIHGQSRYLRAKYVRMSGAKQYHATVHGVSGTNGRSLRGWFRDLPPYTANTLTAGGTGYVTGGPFSVSNSSGGEGTGMTVNIIASAGVVLHAGPNLITIVDQGVGYKQGDELVIDSGNNDAIFDIIGSGTHDLTLTEYVRASMGMPSYGTAYKEGSSYMNAPTDIPQKGTLTWGGNARKLVYDGWSAAGEWSSGSNIEVDFNIISDTGDTPINLDSAILIEGEAPQHTIVVSWELDTPTGGGYWGTANGGPVVQGLGTNLPVWYLTAKPMDGGNMGLPALNHESRGAIPIQDTAYNSEYTLQRGFSRFSIEGLNSCQLPSLPPPDMIFDGPAVMGHAALVSGTDAYSDANKTLPIQTPEYGQKMDGMGPYTTGCFITCDHGAIGGQTPLGATNIIKITTPQVDISDTITQGDTIYNATGQSIGIVDSYTRLERMSPTANPSEDGIRAAGPQRRKSGVKSNYTFQQSAFTTTIMPTVGTNPTTIFAPGDFIRANNGNVMGQIQTGTTPVKAIKPDYANVNHGTGVDYPGIELTVVSSSGQVITVDKDPTPFVMVGEYFHYQDISGGVLRTTTNYITEIDGSAKTITVGDPFPSNAPNVNDTVYVDGITPVCIRFIQGAGPNNFKGNDIQLVDGETDIYVDKHDTSVGVATHPVFGTLNGRADYTTADFEDGMQLTFSDADSPYPHNSQIGIAALKYADGGGVPDPTYTTMISVFGYEGLGATTSQSTTQFYNYAGEHSSAWGGKLYSSDGTYYGQGVLGGEGFRFLSFAGTTIPGGTALYRKTTTITLVANNAVAFNNGDELYYAKTDNKWDVAFENGLKGDVIFGKYEPTSLPGDLATITKLSTGHINTNHALARYGAKDGTNLHSTIPRSFRTVRPINTERVKGLFISNEEKVWENISVKDDGGSEWILEGGSPFGTVIKDYTLPTNRLDPATGLFTTVPSYPGSGITPNMEIQLPAPEEIPGNILVRSGHDRVQAWRNLSWGMGGLTEPRTQSNGYLEQNLDTSMDINEGEATQFDTHDRVLHFHPVRILHDKLQSHFGLTLNNTPGSVPSGTTRLFAAHRLTDHAERGSVLLDTNNGADATNTHPHNRIRFGRQGHHFVTPLATRGTPSALRRQLHRSHGSAYSLMFEGETENKHWGFQSAYTSQDATNYYMDSMEVKGETFNTGSFSSDGFPCQESAYSSLAWHYLEHARHPEHLPDILFAPGQQHTFVEGETEQAHFIAKDSVTTYEPSLIGKADTGAYATVNHGGPVGIVTSTSRTTNNRFNGGGEFAINGFILSQYSLMGGRPTPTQYVQITNIGGITVPYLTTKGHTGGWIQPRVGTELATTPPLLVHDPELMNMAAAPLPNDSIVHSSVAITASGDVTADLTKADMGLIKATDTASGATPDAFLCTWLAEYSHPALLGTSREQYMTFRYREAGMPKSTYFPATRGILLRNAKSPHPSPSYPTQSHVAMPFERIYAFQWLQQYGYNGLNAGGHGADWGERAASAVLMGHSGLREPHGTLELPAQFGSKRMSRGEGIGDGLNPRKTITTVTLEQESTGKPITVITTVDNPVVAIDLSRRLPVRAWGMRGASDAINMLAGDPAQLAAINTSQQAISNSARFDGGKHDTVQDIPTINDGEDWNWPRGYTGVERTTPIGMVLSGHTSEGIEGEGLLRLSNDPWIKGEEEIGMGRKYQDTSIGMISPQAMPAGVVDSDRTEYGATTFTGTDSKYLQAKTMNKGSDPLIGLNHHTGDVVKAKDSVDALTQTAAFGASTGTNFIHQKGNNLHLNAHPVDIFTGTTLGSSTNTDFIHDDHQHHFPAHGWGRDKNMKDTTQAQRATLPIPLSEIADHRQVQSDMSPRFGVITETHDYRLTGKEKDYIVTSTKAVSLHSDLAVGQQFPITPSWVQVSQRSVAGQTKDDGSPDTIVMANSDSTTQPYGKKAAPNQTASKPSWSINPEMNNGVLTNGDSSKMLSAGVVKDHWAVRGSGDLPAWGGVFILRKTWLDRPENNDKERSVLKLNAGKPAHAQPVRKSVDYIVRMVRPLKVFGYTTEANANDGWLLGAMNTLTSTGYEQQPFTRDNRYGIFELNSQRMPGGILPIGSPYDSAPEIAWPDANDCGIVWHLIPSANMLQHFKADASRKDHDGKIHPLVDARYSQSTHPGGKEEVSQSETLYALDNTVMVNPYSLRERDKFATREQPSHTMTTLGPKATILQDGSQTDGGYLIVDDATGFPPSGTLIVIGQSGQYTYESRTDNQFILDAYPPADPLPATGDLRTTADMAGAEVRYGTNLGTGVSVYPGSNLVAGSTDTFTLSTNYSDGGSDPYMNQQLPHLVFALGEVIHTENGVLGTIESIDVATGAVILTDDIVVGLNTDDIIRGIQSTWNSTHKNILPITQSMVIAPSLVDNAITIASYHTDKWDGTDALDITSYSPNLSYRGIGHYDPSDFTFLTPQRFVLSDGQNTGVLSYVQKPGTGGLNVVYVDGAALTPTIFPPYLLDGKRQKWRIAGLVSKEGQGSIAESELQFRNLKGHSLSGSGMSIKDEEYVQLGHYAAIGMRSTDAALLILNDIDQTISGADLIDYETINKGSIEEANNASVTGFYQLSGAEGIPSTTTLPSLLGAHPALSYTIQHSSIFINRSAKGLFILDVLRNLSQMDGYQLIITKGGTLLYTNKVFFNRGRRIGSSSGPQLIEKSAMMEMANHIVIQGDQMAENEIIITEVKDNEKIKAMGGKGGEGLVRTLTQTLPGLRSKNLGLRLAKGFMRRTEQGAAIIRVEGLVNAQDIQAGEILKIDFTMERIQGEFVVFEVHHDYTKGLSNLVIGQYEKGIEGLIADLQAASGGVQPTDATRTRELTEIVLSAPIRVVASSRVMTRMNNNTQMIIGGGWRSRRTTNYQHPLGGVGILGGRTGCFNSGAVSASSTTTLTITGSEGDHRFSVGDLVEVRNPATTSTTAALTTNYDQWQYVGKIAVVATTTLTLSANNAVLIADGAELRVIHKRAKPIGHSKSVWYGVR